MCRDEIRAFTMMGEPRASLLIRVGGVRQAEELMEAGEVRAIEPVLYTDRMSADLLMWHINLCSDKYGPAEERRFKVEGRVGGDSNVLVLTPLVPTPLALSVSGQEV